MRYEEDGTLFTQLMLRTHGSKFLRAETGTEEMTCPRCRQTALQQRRDVVTAIVDGLGRGEGVAA